VRCASNSVGSADGLDLDGAGPSSEGHGQPRLTHHLPGWLLGELSRRAAGASEILMPENGAANGLGRRQGRPSQRFTEGILMMMKSMKSITPREAKAVWDSLKNPSARSVARAMTQAGRRIHNSTVSRWAAQGWRSVAHRPHPLDAARQVLDIAAGILTGAP
jgi:hypothetical protein